MATMRDLDRIALSLPATTKEQAEGRPAYLVNGRRFCHHREPRGDALDTATGERLVDVLIFRTESLDTKELVLADPRRIFFTTPHFDGYAAVLVRIPDLARLGRDELWDVVVDAWLTRAPKRLAKQWLAEHEPAD